MSEINTNSNFNSSSSSSSSSPNTNKADFNCREIEIGRSNVATFSQDGQFLAHASQGNDTVRIYSLLEDREIASFRVDQVSGLLFRKNYWLGLDDYNGHLPSNELFICEGDKHCISRYLPSLKAHLKPLKLPNPTAIASDTSSRYLACGTISGELHIFDFESMGDKPGITAALVVPLKSAIVQVVFINPQRLMVLTENGIGYYLAIYNKPVLSLSILSSFSFSSTVPQKVHLRRLAAHPRAPQVALAGDSLLVCGLGQNSESQYELKTTLEAPADLLEFLDNGNIFVSARGVGEILAAPPLGRATEKDCREGIKFKQKIAKFEESSLWRHQIDGQIRAVKLVGTTINAARSRSNN